MEVIPTKTEPDSYRDHGVAVFRYFVKIVAKDRKWPRTVPLHRNVVSRVQSSEGVPQTRVESSETDT